MRRLMHWMGTCLMLVLLTGCKNYPDRLFFKGESAYPAAWPILFGTISVNQSPHPILGKGNADIAMPPPVDDDMVLLSIPWVEYHSGASWTAELQVPLSQLGGAQRTVDLNVRIGRNGSINLFGVVAGDSAMVSLFAVCADRTPDADDAFEQTIAHHASLDNWEPPGSPIAAAPPTPCKPE